jgi:predicted TIM-barrel fold metal-dependent hydrolase
MAVSQRTSRRRRVLNLLAKWVPDTPTRQKILVDNPKRLYEF